MMEVPGRDVTADIDRDATEPTTDEPTADAGRDDGEGLMDKVREAADSVKEKVASDDR